MPFSTLTVPEAGLGLAQTVGNQDPEPVERVLRGSGGLGLRLRGLSGTLALAQGCWKGGGGSEEAGVSLLWSYFEGQCGVGKPGKQLPAEAFLWSPALLMGL